MTDDPALESAARDVASFLRSELQLLKTNDEATCVGFDTPPGGAFAILDTDARSGTRSMFDTVAGLLPVIAVTRKSKPWLQSMLRRHRIGVSVSKPVSRETLRTAFQQIGDFHGRHAQSSH